MKIAVKVKPNARQSRVEVSESGYTVYVTEPPQDNKANKAVIKMLSGYLKVAKSRITIVRGAKSREKLIEINK